MKKAIYAFKVDDEGRFLESIATHTYDSEDEETRVTAIESIQSAIQGYDPQKVLVLDAQKLYVVPVNKIKF